MNSICVWRFHAMFQREKNKIEIDCKLKSFDLVFILYIIIIIGQNWIFNKLDLDINLHTDTIGTFIEWQLSIE